MARVLRSPRSFQNAKHGVPHAEGLKAAAASALKGAEDEAEPAAAIEVTPTLEEAAVVAQASSTVTGTTGGR